MIIIFLISYIFTIIFSYYYFYPQIFLLYIIILAHKGNINFFNFLQVVIIAYGFDILINSSSYVYSFFYVFIYLITIKKLRGFIRFSSFNILLSLALALILEKFLFLILDIMISLGFKINILSIIYEFILLIIFTKLYVVVYNKFDRNREYDD